MLDCFPNSMSVIESSNMLPFKGLCIDGDVRLEDGVKEYDGRIEICYNDEWGSVCDDYVNDSVAEVVCRQLGFSLYSKCIVNSVLYQC